MCGDKFSKSRTEWLWLPAPRSPPSLVVTWSPPALGEAGVPGPPGWGGGRVGAPARGAGGCGSSFSSRSQIIENCPVTGIRVRTDDFGVRRVAAVETEHGSIQTPCVVNCAGETGPRRPPPSPAELRGGGAQE